MNTKTKTPRHQYRQTSRKGGKTHAASNAAYFGLLKTYCAALELPNTPAIRHDATRQALGYDKSSTLWTTEERDLVMGFLRWRISGVSGEWGPAQRTLIEIEGKRSRLLWRIRKEIPEAYLAEIAKDKFKSLDYRSMSLPDLEQLRITAIERARAAKRQNRNLHNS